MSYKQAVTHFLTRNFPAMVSGIGLTISFPDVGWSWMMFFAMVPWLMSMEDMEVKEALTSGFMMGMVHYLSLIYWIVPTVHVYGRLHLVLAFSTLMLLCVYLSLYPAVFAFFLKKLGKKSELGGLLPAAVWVGLEYIRTHAFTGFPWGVLGYSQFSNLLLIQISDVTGVLGVSFVIVSINFCILQILKKLFRKSANLDYKGIVVAAALAGLVIVYGNARIHMIDRKAQKTVKPMVSVIQGNIRQDIKWGESFKQKTVEKYIRLSEMVNPHKPELIIWPETALPFYYGRDIALSRRVDASVRQSGTHFLIGSPALEKTLENIRFYNRAYMLNRFSIVTGTFDKTHLVPFGEYVPFGRYLTFLGKITEHAGNFSKGEAAFIPLEFNSHKTGVLICFEILFPSISSAFAKNGADILTTLTNDAWFGRSSAAMQHFSIAVFRAVENRRSMVRAANTGISGFIDPTGKILKTSGLFQDQTLTLAVPILKELSFYSLYGDVFARGCLVAIVIFFVIKGVRKRVKENKT